MLIFWVDSLCSWSHFGNYHNFEYFRKKLRDIEALEAKLASGEISTPEPEQLEKVSSFVQIQFVTFVTCNNWRRSAALYKFTFLFNLQEH